jgi:hypothetical protein
VNSVLRSGFTGKIRYVQEFGASLRIYRNPLILSESSDPERITEFHAAFSERINQQDSDLQEGDSSLRIDRKRIR